MVKVKWPAREGIMPMSILKLSTERKECVLVSISSVVYKM